MAIRIVTDSCCDLPEDIIKRYDVTVLPLRIAFGSEEFLDRVTIQPKAFFDKMKVSSELPKTSCPSTETIEACFEKIAAAGDEAVAIMLSSGLSSTSATAALLAKNIAPDKLHVIDSMSATFGEGLLVMEAAKMVDAGCSALETVERIEHLKTRHELLAVFGDLTNLKKGGRISPTQAMLSTALNIKPILDIRGGCMNVTERVRGMKKAYQFIRQRFESLGRDNSLPIMSGHADGLEERAEIEKLLSEVTDMSKIVRSDVGCTIGTHTGSNCAGISWFRKN